MRAIAPGDALDVVASQQHDVLERTKLTSEQTAAAAWTVAGEGSERVVVGGARAIALAIAIGRDAAWPTAFWRLPGFAWVVDRIYLLVARYRNRLPGETAWCTAHPGQCSEAD